MDLKFKLTPTWWRVRFCVNFARQCSRTIPLALIKMCLVLIFRTFKLFFTIFIRAKNLSKNNSLISFYAAHNSVSRQNTKGNSHNANEREMNFHAAIETASSCCSSSWMKKVLALRTLRAFQLAFFSF
jgi:hypothetical protein